MKTEDIKLLSDVELDEKIDFERDNLQKIMFKHKVSSLENPTTIGITRKLIARLLTEQNIRRKKLIVDNDKLIS